MPRLRDALNLAMMITVTILGLAAAMFMLNTLGNAMATPTNNTTTSPAWTINSNNGFGILFLGAVAIMAFALIVVKIGIFLGSDDAAEKRGKCSICQTEGRIYTLYKGGAKMEVCSACLYR